MLGLVLVAPREQLLPGLDLSVALDRAPQQLVLYPLLAEVVEDGDGAGDVGQGGRAHHPARDHEGRVRPLAAEDGVDLHGLCPEDHAGLVALAHEGREAPHGLLVARGLGVLLVHEIDGEDGVEPAWDRLQCLAGLRDVADQDGVGGQDRPPCRVEGVAGLRQVAATADAADPRGHDEAGLGVLASQDHLEATEHEGLRVGLRHVVVGDLDVQVEIALDATQRAHFHLDGVALGDGHLVSVPFDRSVRDRLRRRTCPHGTTAARRSGRRRPRPCS